MIVTLHSGKDRMNVDPSGEAERGTKLRDSINRRIGRGIADYSLIREGDRILVALSGGKDSLTLLYFLRHFQKKAPVSFHLEALHVDQTEGANPARIATMRELAASWGIELRVETTNILPLVREKLPEGETPCSLCGRLRRGVLYRIAREMGCNKIALGHHRDDFLETFLLNSFFAGKLGGMTPVYRVQKGDLSVIRPLHSIPEQWIRDFVSLNGWNVVTCDDCGVVDGFRRKEMKELLARLESEHPGLKDSLFASLGNLHTEELMDRRFWKNGEFAEP